MDDLKKHLTESKEPTCYIKHIEGLLKKAQSYVEQSAGLFDDAKKLNEEIKECVE